MGKGVIISGGTDGQYQVSVQYNVERVQAEKAANLEKITNLADRISQETDEQKLKILKLQKLSLEKRNEILDAIPESEEISAWCADLTEDLAGEVGLIEVPGESTAFNIQPGYEDNGAYNAARDGQLTPTMAMDPAAAFYNLAMLPGWQKWKPTYRYGTITAIDGDTADVVLDAAVSTQQGLGVNQGTTLSGVPIEYMSCNGAAFEEGDEVLVKFTGQDWGNPLVVGFKDNPGACEIPFYIRVTFNGAAPGIGGERIYFEYPDDPDGNFEKTYIVSADGLMGPFIQGSDPVFHAIDGTRISLFWNRAEAPIRPIFHYFIETSEAEASHTARILKFTGNTGNAGIDVRLRPMPDATGQKFFKKIYRIRPAGSIFEMPVTIESIDDVEYPVYAVDFELKMIQAADVTFDMVQHCTECNVLTGLSPDEYGYGESAGLLIDADHRGVDFRECEASDPVGWDYYVFQEDFGDNLISCSATLDNIVITTDSNGLNPTFTPFSYAYANDRIYELREMDGGGLVCDVRPTLETSGTFKLSNSPEMYL